MVPEISVLTPSLNYGRFIDDALRSVALQANVRLEHLVQDGGSTDSTIDVLRGVESPVNWRSGPDRGQSDALNAALARAQGRWIGWLNADEFYLPGGLSALLEAAEETSADVVFGDTMFVDESGRAVRLMSHHPFRSWYLRWYGCYIASCSVLFRRDVFGHRPWNEAFGMAMDWDLYLRLTDDRAAFKYVRYPVAAFRLHGAQVIAREQSFADEFVALQKHRGVRPKWQRRLGRWPHDVDKLLHGAYSTQTCSRRIRGRDLRWFRDQDASQAARELLEQCYGVTKKRWARGIR